MAMDPLGAASPVMEILRRQMSDNLAKLRPTGAASGGPAPRLESRPSPAALRQTLARRLRALDERAADYPERAATVFVESVLTAEFGDERVNDPAFRLLVREVAGKLRGHAAIAADLRELIAELRD